MARMSRVVRELQPDLDRLWQLRCLLNERLTDWTACVTRCEQRHVEVMSDGVTPTTSQRSSLLVRGKAGSSWIAVGVPWQDERAVVEASLRAATTAATRWPSAAAKQPLPAIVAGFECDFGGDWDALVSTWLPVLFAPFERGARLDQVALILERSSFLLCSQAGARRTCVVHRSLVELTRLPDLARGEPGAARLFALPSPRPRSLQPLVKLLPSALPARDSAARGGRTRVRLQPPAAARVVLHQLMRTRDARRARLPWPASGQSFPSFQPSNRRPRPDILLTYCPSELSLAPTEIPSRCDIAPGRLPHKPQAGALVVHDVEEVLPRSSHASLIARGGLAHGGSVEPLGAVQVDLAWSALGAIDRPTVRGGRTIGFSFDSLDVFTPAIEVEATRWRRL